MSVSSRISRDLTVHELQCDELLRAAHLAILQWLLREAPTAVLPPRAAEPRIEVMADAWTTQAGAAQSIAITAWDQLGMVPRTHLRGTSPLAAVLPDAVLPSTAPLRADHAGLDAIDPGIRRFPVRGDDEPAIGALIATHNPLPIRREPMEAGSINVNTAPIELIELALRLHQRDGLEQIAEARAAGRLKPSLCNARMVRAGLTPLVPPGEAARGCRRPPTRRQCA